MTPFFSRLRKPSFLEAALGIVLLHSPMQVQGQAQGQAQENTSDGVGFLSAPAHKGGKVIEQLPSENEIHNTPSLKDIDKKKDTYTINFNNVSIIEYIRF